MTFRASISMRRVRGSLGFASVVMVESSAMLIRVGKLQVDESAVAYWSDDDGVWIAHGLRTDQLGTGETRDEALADLHRAVMPVLELADADESLAYLRESPPEFQVMPVVTDW